MGVGGDGGERDGGEVVGGLRVGARVGRTRIVMR